MSSPVAINRPVSPAESSVSSSVSGSVVSISSRRSAPLFYTRDELLSLATSPLSQTPPPPAIAAFPMIMRKTRRGVLEAYQTLDYVRSTSGITPSPAPAPAPVRDSSPNSNAGYPTRSTPPRARQTDVPAQLPPPMWKVDVYVPPARRAEQEQRARPGRDARSLRTWRRPAQARAQTQSRW